MGPATQLPMTTPPTCDRYWPSTREGSLTLGARCASVGGELAGQVRPLLEVGEQFSGQLDSGGEELAEQVGRGHVHKGSERTLSPMTYCKMLGIF
jgi:hypothetical protein